jgi:flagellar biosynthetic protein FliR
MFLADVGLALLARTAPQFNVFVVGIPIKILVGLAMLVLLMTGFGTLFQMLFDRMLAALQKLLDIVQAAG